jgi:hypothetical protein
MAGVQGPIPREEAEAIAVMMVAGRRVPPPGQFVDWMVEKAESASLDWIV